MNAVTSPAPGIVSLRGTAVTERLTP